MYPFASPMMIGQGAALPTIGWNPNDKGPNWTVSADGRSATLSGANRQAVRGLKFLAAGKAYGEMVYVAGSQVFFGFGNANVPLTDNVGNTSDGVRYANSGAIVNSANQITTVAALSVGDVVGIAIDRDAGSFSYYRNGALQYSYGGNFPFPAGPIALIGGGADGASIRLNLTAAQFTYAPPSGFSPWG